MYHNCEVKGHSSKVCKSKKKQGMKSGNVATMYILDPTLCALDFTAAFPSSVSQPVVTDGVILTVLIDSCNTNNQQVAKIDFR